MIRQQTSAWKQVFLIILFFIFTLLNLRTHTTPPNAARHGLLKTSLKHHLNLGNVFCNSTSGVRREGTAVLNIFNDHDYNRSVITIVASIDSISKYRIFTFMVK